MASKRKAFLSRSVSLSLAALIVLTGAMFLITTLEQDHQEWKLVEDQVFDLYGVSNLNTVPSVSPDNYSDLAVVFDEETSVYSLSIPADTYSKTSGKFDVYAFSALDAYDTSKTYKVVFSSSAKFDGFGLFPSSNPWFSLKTIEAVDGVYTCESVLYDQYVTDISYSAFWISVSSAANSSYLIENEFSFQVYELHDDNAGSVAAAITGLTLIVMGVFATPMLNVFRRK